MGGSDRDHPHSARQCSKHCLALSLIDNPLRRIVPTGPSQNVVAVVPPAAEHRQDLVLIGHLDTARIPLIFSSPRWLAVYKAFTTVTFVVFISQALLYVLGAFTGWAFTAAFLAAMDDHAADEGVTHV